MNSSGLKKRRRFGQIFLTNPEIAQFEVSRIPVDSRTVLEIGSGSGVLTEQILQKGFVVTAVEPDHVYSDLLSTRFHEEVSTGSLRIVQQDFIDLVPGEYDCIVGNIPYFLSSGIMFKLFEYRFGKAILMVQKEFADKVTAQPGTREAGRITYSLQLRGELSYLRTVPRVFFDPKPEVDSAIIEIVPRQRYGPIPENADEVLRSIFSSRRKKLSSIFGELPKDYGERRGETLSMEEFLDLCGLLKKTCQ